MSIRRTFTALELSSGSKKRTLNNNVSLRHNKWLNLPRSLAKLNPFDVSRMIINETMINIEAQEALNLFWINLMSILWIFHTLKFLFLIFFFYPKFEFVKKVLLCCTVCLLTHWITLFLFLDCNLLIINISYPKKRWDSHNLLTQFLYNF